MIRVSIKWLIVLLLFALIVVAWGLDGGAGPDSNAEQAAVDSGRGAFVRSHVA